MNEFLLGALHPFSTIRGYMNRGGKQPSTSPSQGVSSSALQQRAAATNRWRDSFNPLRGLTINRAISLLEQYQRGEFAHVLWTQYFIEQTDPDLVALIERRLSALKEMDTQVKGVAKNRAGSRFDQVLKDEQVAFLEEEYGRVDNIKEAIEHLALASFRGFAHCQPRINGNSGPVATLYGAEHIECLDQWNFVRDGMYGDWKWNPDAMLTTYRALDEKLKVDMSTMIFRSVDRPINRIALLKFIRSNLSEKDWDGFIEIYGIPACIIIGPAKIPAGDEVTFKEAAQKVADGGSGVLPNGSTVDRSESVRGVTPFKARLDHLTEKLILAGTGGKLTMLSSPTGIGGGASDAQEETFKSIARAEGLMISEAFQQCFDAPKLDAQFPGRPHLAYFEIAVREEQDVGTIIEHAAKLVPTGFTISKDVLEEESGYKLVPVPLNASDPNGLPGRVSFRNRSSGKPGPDDPAIGQLMAEGRLQLAEAEHKALAAVATRLQELMANAEDEGSDPAALEAELIRFRDEELPKMLVELGTQPEAAAVIAELAGAAMAQGLEIGVSPQ